MDLKKIVVTLVGLVFSLIISLPCPVLSSSEPLSKGATLPGFELKGVASPQTKDYLGVHTEKKFTLSQVQAKLILVEFFDVY